MSKGPQGEALFVGKRPRGASCFALVFPLRTESAQSPPPLGSWPGLLGQMTLEKDSLTSWGCREKQGSWGVPRA